MGGNNQNKQEQNSTSTSGGDKQPGGQQGTAAGRAEDMKNTRTPEADIETGDPGRTPGTAEGVENVEETGNE